MNGGTKSIIAASAVVLLSVLAFAPAFGGDSEAGIELTDVQQKYDDYTAAAGLWPDGDPNDDLLRLAAMRNQLNDIKQAYGNVPAFYGWPDGDPGNLISQLEMTYNNYLSAVNDYIDAVTEQNGKLDSLRDEYDTALNGRLLAYEGYKAIQIAKLLAGSYELSYKRDDGNSVTTVVKGAIEADYLLGKRQTAILGAMGVTNSITGLTDDDYKRMAAFLAEDTNDKIIDGKITASESRKYKDNIIFGTERQYTITIKYTISTDEFVAAERLTLAWKDLSEAESAFGGISNEAMAISASAYDEFNMSESNSLIFQAHTLIEKADIEYVSIIVKDGSRTIQNGSSMDHVIPRNADQASVRLTVDIGLSQTSELEPGSIRGVFSYSVDSSNTAVAEVNMAGNAITITPKTAGTFKIDVGLEYAAPEYVGGKMVVIINGTVSLTLHVYNELSFAKDRYDLGTVSIGSGDDYGDRTVGIPEASGGKGTITYSLADSPADSRISLAGNQIKIGKDANSGTYSLDIAATDSSATTARTEVTFIVVNHYDGVYRKQLDELQGIEDQVKDLIMLIELLPDGTVDPAYIEQLRMFADVTGPLEDSWNGGYPTINGNSYIRLAENIDALKNVTDDSVALVTIDALSSLFRGVGDILNGPLGSTIAKYIPSDKKTLIEGYSFNLPAIGTISLPSATSGYVSLVTEIWGLFQDQIGPLQNLIDSFSSLKDYIEDYDYRSIDSISDIDDYIQGLHDRYSAFDGALNGFVDSDSFIVDIIDAVLMNSKDIISAGLNTTDEMIKLIVQPIIDQYVTDDQMKAMIEDFINGGLESLISFLDEQVSGIPNISLETIAGISGQIDDAIRTVAGKSAIVVLTVDYVKKIDIGASVDEQIADLEEYAAGLMRIAEKYQDEDALSLANRINEKITDYRLITDYLIRAYEFNVYIMGYTYKDIHTLADGREYIKDLYLKHDAMHTALSNLTNLTPGAKKIAGDVLSYIYSNLLECSQEIKQILLWIGVTDPEAQFDSDEIQLVVDTIMLAFKDIEKAAQTDFGDLESVIAISERINEALKKAYEGFGLIHVKFMSEGNMIYEKTYKLSESVVFPLAKKAGVPFSGWNTDGSGIYEAGEIVQAADLAKYGENIVFDAQFGVLYTVAFGDLEYTGVAGYVFSVPYGPHIDGKTFLRWSSADWEYQPGDRYTVSGDAAFSAEYEEIVPETKYTVTFGDLEYTGVAGYGFSVPYGPHIDGKTFLRWSSADWEYQPGDRYTVSGDAAFSAEYECNILTVMFGESKYSLVAGEDVTVPKPNGKGFLYWQNEDDQHDRLYAGQKVRFMHETSYAPIYREPASEDEIDVTVKETPDGFSVTISSDGLIPDDWKLMLHVTVKEGKGYRTIHVDLSQILKDILDFSEDGNYAHIEWTYEGPGTMSTAYSTFLYNDDGTGTMPRNVVVHS